MAITIKITPFPQTEGADKFPEYLIKFLPEPPEGYYGAHWGFAKGFVKHKTTGKNHSKRYKSLEEAAEAAKNLSDHTEVKAITMSRKMIDDIPVGEPYYTLRGSYIIDTRYAEMNEEITWEKKEEEIEE